MTFATKVAKAAKSVISHIFAKSQSRAREKRPRRAGREIRRDRSRPTFRRKTGPHARTRARAWGHFWGQICAKREKRLLFRVSRGARVIRPVRAGKWYPSRW